MPGERIYRRNAHRLLLPILYMAPVAFFGIFALDLGPGSSPAPGERIVYGALCLPWLALAVRTLRIGVVVGEEGVTVRNVLRTRRVRWEDIDCFELGKWGGFPIGAARLHDGRAVRAAALNPPAYLGPEPEPGISRLIGELNAELDRARAAGLAGPAPESETGPP